MIHFRLALGHMHFEAEKPPRRHEGSVARERNVWQIVPRRREEYSGACPLECYAKILVLTERKIAIE